MSKEEPSVPSTLKTTVSAFFINLKETASNIFSVSTLFVIFKYLAFVGFSAVSMILSVNMFMRFSDHPIEQIALVSVAITFELFKIFSIVRGNTLSRLRLRSLALRAYILYFILALISIMASYGFTLTVINRGIQARDISTVQLQIETSQAVQAGYQASIDTYNGLIETNNIRQKALPPDWITASKALTESTMRLTSQVLDLQDKLTTERAKETALKIESIEAAASSDSTVGMFGLMAEGLIWLIPDITERSLMLVLLLLISVLIEIGIISSSPAIPIDQKHLKHFIDENSMRRADELMAIAQGKKKKELAIKKLSFVGRVAQIWVDWKTDVKTVLAEKPEEVPVPAPRVSRPALKPSDTTTIGSVPVRRPNPALTIAATPTVSKGQEQVIESSSFQEPITPKATGQALGIVPVKEDVLQDVTFSEPALVEQPAVVQVRTTPAKPAIKPEVKVVDLPRSPSAPPQAVAESKTYRFGKTTEAVRDMFISFVDKLFATDTTTGELLDTSTAAQQAGIAPTLAATFINRLQEIKGSKGNSLIESREGKLYPNYTQEYIINYSTTESAKERTR